MQGSNQIWRTNIVIVVVRIRVKVELHTDPQNTISS